MAAGVHLDLMDADMMQRFGAQALPELKGDSIGVPVLSAGNLGNAVFQSLGADNDDTAGLEDRIDEFDDYQVMRDAVSATARDYEDVLAGKRKVL